MPAAEPGPWAPVAPTFAAPGTLAEALGELDAEGAVALAGGASLTLLLKERLVEPTKIVYLAHVQDLQTLEAPGPAELVLGAGVTLHRLARAGAVRHRTPVLAEVAGRIGNPRVRSVATVGGALAHADPRQDLPPVLLALGARVRIAGPGGRREVPLSRFLVGFMETDLRAGELIVDVVVPTPTGRRASYQRFAPASEDDFATVAAAASLELRPDGTVARAALALGAAGPRAFLVEEAERLAGAGRPSPVDVEAVAAAAADRAEPVADRLGSVAYKREMVRVHARRALQACLTGP